MSGNYEAAIQYLYERINYERSGHTTYSAANYRLARMRRLLELSGDPQSAYKIVHVAGTKGKGSTSHLIAEMLRAGGLATGLYTSPHLLKLEERIRINGRPCSPDELVALVDRMRIAVEHVENDGAGRATFFELTTAMGMLHFASKRVDVAVIEVGLGGRLDSTNVCQPSICVITSIGLDHQAQLGTTIEQIAGEKAGIIKPTVPVICSARDAGARHVITETAAQCRSSIRLIDRDYFVHWAPMADSISKPGDSARCATLLFRPQYDPTLLGISRWQLSMLGSHQADNAGAALATVDWLLSQGWPVKTDSLAEALAEVQVPARVQIVGHSPLQIIDVAHNSDSISATVRTLQEHFPGRKATFVFASSRDKDYRTMLRKILRYCERMIVTQYHKNPRALPATELYQAALEEREICNELRSSQESSPSPGAPSVQMIENPVDAWRIAIQQAGPNEIVLATGSFFLATELLD